jgi:hypothetical protein
MLWNWVVRWSQITETHSLFNASTQDIEMTSTWKDRETKWQLFKWNPSVALLENTVSYSWQLIVWLCAWRTSSQQRAEQAHETKHEQCDTVKFWLSTSESVRTGPPSCQWVPSCTDITISGILLNLHSAIKRKCLSMLMRSVTVLHGNPSPHLAHTVQDTLHFMCWKVLDHSSYNLHLSPCDFHAFGPLKESTRRL